MSAFDIFETKKIECLEKIENLEQRLAEIDQAIKHQYHEYWRIESLEDFLTVCKSSIEDKKPYLVHGDEDLSTILEAFLRSDVPQLFEHFFADYPSFIEQCREHLSVERTEVTLECRMKFLERRNVVDVDWTLLPQFQVWNQDTFVQDVQKDFPDDYEAVREIESGSVVALAKRTCTAYAVSWI
jgi:hypothetical protein